MKAVTSSKRRYTYKDIVLFFVIIVSHYAFFILYIAMVLGIHFALKSGSFFPNFNYRKWFIIYPSTIAPAVNAMLHILYAEKGGPWLRFIMWVHTMVNIIVVPVIIFVD